MDIPDHLFVDFFHRAHDPMQILQGQKFVAFNAATARVLGYSDPELIKKAHPSEFSPERQSDGALSFDKGLEMMELAHSNGSHVFDWDHVDAQGQLFTVEVALTSVGTGDDRVLYSVWRDVTQRLKQQEERIELERQIHHLNKLKSLGQLSSEIAHDFKNYLQIMIGYAEVSHALSEDQTLRANLDEIMSAGSDASELVSRILNFGRQEASEDEQISMGSLLANMRDLAEPLLPPNIKLTFDLNDQVDSRVLGQRNRLEDALLNLIVNARDAMPDGGELRISLKQFENHQCALVVKDSGVGMSPQLYRESDATFLYH